MKKSQSHRNLKFLLSVSCALSLFSSWSATGFAAEASNHPYAYDLVLDRLVAEKKLPENEQLKVEIGVPSNKAHDFFAIRAVTLPSTQELPAGSVLEFDSRSVKKVEIDLDQVDALKNSDSGAILGLQINVTRKSSFLQTFFEDAATGFLSAGSENFLLQEADYSPTSSRNESPVFDPRTLAYDKESNSTSFKVSNEYVEVLMKVIRTQNQ